MIWTILSVVLATSVLAGLLFRWTRPSPAYVFDANPDAPVSFGKDMFWIAIRTTDTEAVVEALGLVDAKPANWETGTSAIYEPALRATAVFVSPPVDDWTLVAGLSLPHPATGPFVDKCKPLLERLGRRFDEVLYFANDAVVDLHAWARIAGGKLRRGYAVIDSHVVWSEGRPERTERELGLSLFEVRGVENRSGDIGGELLLHPTAEHVLQIARRWAIDPTSLGRSHAEVSARAGYVASAPHAWRVERKPGLARAA